MKLIYVLGIFLLFGLAFCEEAAEQIEGEEPSDELADETENQPEEDEESSDENEEDEESSDEDDEDEESSNEVEDASHSYKPKCYTSYKKVCNHQKVCRPKYFYVKGSRKVKYCFNKLLKRTRRECRKFCWHTAGYGYGKYYRKGRRVCRRRCYRVPRVKKICRFRRIFYPKWTFKNVCKYVKNCYTIPVKKCYGHHGHHGHHGH